MSSRGGNDEVISLVMLIEGDCRTPTLRSGFAMTLIECVAIKSKINVVQTFLSVLRQSGMTVVRRTYKIPCIQQQGNFH